MTILFLLGILLLFILLANRKKAMKLVGQDNRFVKRLSNLSWYRNPWFGGFFLFLLNGFLFGMTFLILYGLTYLMIPFIHLFVMLAAVIISIYAWFVIHTAWKGSKGGRVLKGLIGSSFYLLLAIYFTYMISTIKPEYPGQDTFMEFVGLFIAISVTSVAFITCFLITGVTRKNYT